MKRILFNPLVENVRGSLTGAQDLLYAKDYNPAYDSPQGKKNGARNYHANYIAKVSAATNEPFLVIRKRSSVRMSPAMVQQMAVQGGTSALYNLLKDGEQAAAAQILYEHDKEVGYIPEDWSFRKYWWQPIFAMIKQQSSRYSARWGKYQVEITNPWRDYDSSLPMQVSNVLLLKFWTALAGDNSKILLVEDRGIKLKMMWNGVDAWEDVIAANYNTLGFGADRNGFIKLGLYYVNVISNGAEHTMTAEELPSAGMFTSPTLIQ